MNKLSVIVPIYNVENYIERCVHSLFSQSLNDLEFIFVNDCSEDTSIDRLMQVLDEYPHRQMQVKVINLDEHKGPSVARNKGILVAEGDYLTFCDSDDFVHKDIYKKMLEKAESVNADIVACAINIVERQGLSMREQRFGQDELRRESILDLTKVEGGIYSALWNKIYRMTFVKEHNLLFDESIVMWEDLHFNLRARYFADAMYIVDTPLYNYCLRKGSIIDSEVCSKIESQIKSVKLIEHFFIDENVRDLYNLLIAYLKLRAKEALIGLDYSQWISTFEEVNSEICKFIKYNGVKLTIKYLALAYGRAASVPLINFVSRLRKTK